MRASDTAADDRATVLRVGLTRVEVVNASFGRAVGDALIEAAAMRLGRLCGADRVERLDGPEFEIAGQGDPLPVAQEIVDRLARPFLLEGQLVNAGCCVGIGRGRAGEDREHARRRALLALALARSGDGPAIRSVDTEEAYPAFLAGLARDLPGALVRDEIDVLYQPQVAVVGGAVVGVEALARWRHPDLGEIGAATLFTAAAEAKCASSLSAHILERATCQAARWLGAAASLRLALNVTASDVSRPNFVDDLLALVDRSRFPRERLTIELTESELVTDLGRAADLLAELRTAGCRVAIDDFGTGYSSLAYLKALPLDYLKIDKQMVADIAIDARDRIILRCVIEMARSLGLSVIAEGVENAEQLDLLAAEGCELYQGFLFAEPLTNEALQTRLTNGRSLAYPQS